MENTEHEKTCDVCSAVGLLTTWEDEIFNYGSGEDAVTLTARVPVRSCSQCGYSYTGEEAETIRHDAVCRHLGRLTPAEIRGIRGNNGNAGDNRNQGDNGNQGNSGNQGNQGNSSNNGNNGNSGNQGNRGNN